MKKHILLTTTAMLLSAIATNTNAASNSAELDIEAFFVRPFEITKEQYLGFGVILADEGGKKVVVKADGSLGEDTSATMMSSATFKNYGDSTNDFLYGSFNEGLFRVNGLLSDDYDGTMSIPQNETALNLFISVNFNTPSVDLTSNKESIKCGTVSDFTTNLTLNDEDVLIHVGGTLTTANLKGTTRSLRCSGSATLTIIFNEDVFAAAQNGATGN